MCQEAPKQFFSPLAKRGGQEIVGSSREARLGKYGPGGAQAVLEHNCKERSDKEMVCSRRGARLGKYAPGGAQTAFEHICKER